MKYPHDKFILNERGEPVLAKDLLTWATWFEKSMEKRIVKRNTIGPYLVSTVFLSLDHNFDEGPPILWETMVFMKEDTEQKHNLCRFIPRLGPEQACNRCAGGREQALAMHADMVERVEAIHALTLPLAEITEKNSKTL